MKRNKEARDAYVEAEITTALAHQIRTMRMDRNLSQAELAKQMKTTQAAISRLEDPSYGQLTLQTLFKLSHAFDTGLRVEFVSTLAMLNATYKPNEAARHIASFEEEAEDVVFYTPAQHTPNQSTLTLQSKTIPAISTSLLAESITERYSRCDYLQQLTVNADASRDDHHDFFYPQTRAETATVYTSS
ncbi:helix-turn-helix transcriptional regulator [Comamonas aquatica]|nr:helix-turn-helix transcriptional regulator [Comamonas aquatica]